jgi:glycosyltransferase involved in cell wall biosynthesis
MKIVYVSSPIYSQFGGGERVIETLMDTLPNARHVFVGNSVALGELFQRRNAEVHEKRGGWEPVSSKNLLLFPLSYVIGLFQVLSLRNIYKKADVIVSPTSFTEVFFTIPWIKLFWHKKIVIMLQNAKVPKAIGRTFLRTIFAASTKNCTVICVSEVQKNELIAQGLPLSEVVIIPNAVVSSSFSPAERATGQLTLGYLSRIDREKSLDTLFKALSKDGLPNITLKIGGEGPYLQDAKTLAQNLPSNITIEWLGFVTNVKAFYESIELLVFPTRREAFGLILVEAWERGVPVLCSDIPSLLALKAASFPEEQALTMKLDNPDSCAQGIEAFIANRTTYTSVEYQQKLHSIAIEKFGISEMAESYKKVLGA